MKHLADELVFLIIIIVNEGNIMTIDKQKTPLIFR